MSKEDACMPCSIWKSLCCAKLVLHYQDRINLLVDVLELMLRIRFHICVLPLEYWHTMIIASLVLIFQVVQHLFICKNQ